MKHPISPPRWLLASAAFIASTLLFASTAHALTMTFDDEVDSSPPYYIFDVLPYEEDGLKLRNGTSDIYNGLFDSQYEGRDDRPTDYFGWILGSVELVTISGDPFTLTSIQFGNMLSGVFFDIEVTGNFVGGGNTSVTLSITSDPWATHSFSSAWTDLQSVIFSTEATDVEEREHPTIDTVVANTASVPDTGSALAMLGCSILGLAWLRRKLG